jgi:tRNA (guanine37-N1)-methyltransferase
MRIDIVTLFPDMCESVVGESIIGRARRAGRLQIFCHYLRDYTLDRFGRVDDTPYGGGRGMILQAQPLADCCEAVAAMVPEPAHIIYMSPKGTLLTQQKAVELSLMPRLLLVCGRYEGVDQRFIDESVDEEISVGDYVLTGGELAALVLADAVGRLCEGVLAEQVCYTDESHFSGLLEYPHYTRPALWRERAVPDVLLSGNHKQIDDWRRQRSLELTQKRRPDLLNNAQLTGEDREYLRVLSGAEESQEKEP